MSSLDTWATRSRDGLVERFGIFGESAPMLGRLTHPTQPLGGGIVIARSIDADQRLTGPASALVDLLAGAGHHVLRFDYRGQGQSLGNPTALTIETMGEDTADAARWLKATLAVSPIALLGVGLGGTAAASRRDLDEFPLAVWDPIVGFDGFMHRLARERLVVEMGFSSDHGLSDTHSLADLVADDLIDDEFRRRGWFDASGHVVGARLRDSVIGCDLRANLRRRSGRALVVGDEPVVDALGGLADAVTLRLHDPDAHAEICSWIERSLATVAT